MKKTDEDKQGFQAIFKTNSFRGDASFEVLEGPTPIYSKKRWWHRLLRTISFNLMFGKTQGYLYRLKKLGGEKVRRN